MIQTTASEFVWRGQRYRRPPVPVHFPWSEKVPEGRLEFDLRVALYHSLRLAFGERAAIGADQFVYWNPTTPTECLAPDVFVRLDAPNHSFRTWKVWERGAPHVAVEIVSFRDRPRDWPRKLANYRQLGVPELVRYDPYHAPQRFRVWDYVEGDLVERALGTGSTPSKQLPGHWVVVPDAELGHMLRLSRDPEGRDLYPTLEEVSQREAEARQREAEARQREAEARQREAEALAAAEERIRQLEAELRRRG